QNEQRNHPTPAQQQVRRGGYSGAAERSSTAREIPAHMHKSGRKRCRRRRPERALQAGGRRFEPCTAHFGPHGQAQLAYPCGSSVSLRSSTREPWPPGCPLAVAVQSGHPKGTERMAGTTSERARQRFLDALASGVTVSAAASAAAIG